MFTHKRLLRYYTEEGQVSETIEEVSGDGEVTYDGTIAFNATPANSEVEVDVAFAFAKIKSIVLSAPGKAVTVRSNADHTGSPGNTVAIPAGGAILWVNTDLAAGNPFKDANVTKLYATNESATTNATLKVRVLLDVTP